MKRVCKPGRPENYELSIISYLLRPEVVEDPQSKCVPIYEILDDDPNDPECVIIVMPLLQNFDSPRFDTVGECLGFIRDIFEVW